MSHPSFDLRAPRPRARHPRVIVVILLLLAALPLVPAFPRPEIPAALAAAALVVGAFLLLLRLSEAGARADAAEARAFDGQTAPVFLTDARGRVRSRNAAAEGQPRPGGWLPAAEAARYRLVREAVANGVAREEAEGRRLVVTRHGRGRLLWREEAASPPPAGSGGGAALDLPWIRLDETGAVLATNAALDALAGGAAPARIEDLVTDPPLRSDGAHRARGSGAALRAVLLGEGDGRREFLMTPLDPGAVSGLMPDDFLEDLPVALARLEPSGALTFANKAARALLGARACPGARIDALMEGMARPIPERVLDTLRGRSLGRAEVARAFVDGQEIFLQVIFTRAVLDGAPSVLAILSDATELKSLEAQFVQSQKMQAVGQLAGGIAHDFNNLLTVIKGHCDLLLMRHDVVDVEHGDLMQIRQNADRAAALVGQLLAFSRKQTLRPTVISLQDTLSELSHLLNRLLTDKVLLRIEHGPDLAPVRVDERQLEQVIMNLVVNARDAMPRGGEVRVTTRNARLEQDEHRDRAMIPKGDYVVIEVADSGTGIPRDTLNKIFEPFYTTKPVGEGTGLGLSTAYGIIKQTGGFIFADSPAGQGAIFTIYLPAHDLRAEPGPPPEPEAPRPRDLTGRGLVLLVEDEDPVRSFAARALRLRGYTVVEASSGEEALDILRDADFRVDMMLSDVIMPGLDGPAWVREAIRTRPEAKVIFMSGYAEDAFVGGESGIPNAAFLAKPFSMSELTQRVKELLDG
ncbi:MAG: hybrid sensor histidine kinase/response regulator [Rhodovulum sulfidophilum]|uniref:histidine kinase n=1 Tax=Rhodovulum sulfidophilum TaxID=35806 RepID=A0A2W5PT73_RHOSU|nr:MAG: hybrid sensor histidine kinase/response regulator [Rhodovulum sulfidophilum]